MRPLKYKDTAITLTWPDGELQSNAFTSSYTRLNPDVHLQIILSKEDIHQIEDCQICLLTFENSASDFLRTNPSTVQTLQKKSNLSNSF